LPEGTDLSGVVLQAKPSKSFGRNGQLRFVFSGVQRSGENIEQVHGTLTGATGSVSQNITIDQEGGMKSNPDKNRFVAPLVIATGFGIVARIVALPANDRNVATGFGVYAFAKSIYFRFLTRGHAVVFPKDTLVEVDLSTRQR